MRIAFFLLVLLAAGPARAADADGDGVPDAADRCPHEPETRDGLRDDDGCPEIDAWGPTGTTADPGAASDGAFRPATWGRLPPALTPRSAPRDADPVGPRDDLCPGQDEDLDGFEDEDGCPDPDNDGDGIHDEDDACPLVAEDADGRLDDDGCPESEGPAAPAAQGPDGDGDGVPDATDRCPHEPENADGRRDHDGCPESPELPAPPNWADALVATGDRDGDGVHDLVDLCPEDPEDPDRFDDADGCPDPDNDGDGIADRVDRCPLEAESPNGTYDGDGCPDGGDDHDRDQVDDAFDVCPWEAEDRDGVRDEDGCPEVEHAPTALANLPVDAPPPTGAQPAALRNALPAPPRGGDLDGDGLTLLLDDCPTEPEDFDGFLDGDGCPDLDDDADGIPDADDACPRRAETLNDFDDADGCPDVAPDIMDSLRGVVRGIAFRSGSAVLLSSSRNVLTDVQSLLNEHPDLALVVVGHTDDAGDPESNRALSEARAAAVAEWLVLRGIARDRVQTSGRGPDQPIESNDTDSGRAANRRVELSYTRREAP